MHLLQMSGRGSAALRLLGAGVAGAGMLLLAMVRGDGEALR